MALVSGGNHDMGALLPHIRKEVQTWYSMCKLQPLVQSVPYLSNPLETMATRTRLQRAGSEPTLRALQECACVVHRGTVAHALRI